MRVRSLLLSAMILALSMPLLADTVFTYTGNTFTSAQSPFTRSDFISGSVTIDVPVAPDTEYIFNSASSSGLVDFTFSDGIDIFSKTYFYNGITNQFTTILGGLSYQIESIDVTTDSNGNIASWFVDIEEFDPTGHNCLRRMLSTSLAEYLSAAQLR